MSVRDAKSDALFQFLSHKEISLNLCVIFSDFAGVFWTDVISENCCEVCSEVFSEVADIIIFIFLIYIKVFSLCFFCTTFIIF